VFHGGKPLPRKERRDAFRLLSLIYVAAQEVQRIVHGMFLGASDSEVARISYQCRLADPALFDSSKALHAYGSSPGPKGSKTAKEVMAERLLNCWREKGGDKGKEGVGSLKTWMFSNPTEEVSRHQTHQNGVLVSGFGVSENASDRASMHT